MVNACRHQGNCHADIRLGNQAERCSCRQPTAPVPGSCETCITSISADVCGEPGGSQQSLMASPQAAVAAERGEP